MRWLGVLALLTVGGAVYVLVGRDPGPRQEVARTTTAEPAGTISVISSGCDL